MRTRRGQPRDTGGRPGRDGAQMMEPEKKRDRGRSRQTDRQTRTHTHRQERTYRAKAAENHVPPPRVWEPQAPGVLPGARPARLPRVRTGGSAPWERADRTVSGLAPSYGGQNVRFDESPGDTRAHSARGEPGCGLSAAGSWRRPCRACARSLCGRSKEGAWRQPRGLLCLPPSCPGPSVSLPSPRGPSPWGAAVPPSGRPSTSLPLRPSLTLTEAEGLLGTPGRWSSPLLSSPNGDITSATHPLDRFHIPRLFGWFLSLDTHSRTELRSVSIAISQVETPRLRGPTCPLFNKCSGDTEHVPGEAPASL